MMDLAAVPVAGGVADAASAGRCGNRSGRVGCEIARYFLRTYPEDTPIKLNRRGDQVA